MYEYFTSSLPIILTFIRVHVFKTYVNLLSKGPSRIEKLIGCPGCLEIPVGCNISLQQQPHAPNDLLDIHWFSFCELLCDALTTDVVNCAKCQKSISISSAVCAMLWHYKFY